MHIVRSLPLQKIFGAALLVTLFIGAIFLSRFLSENGFVQEAVSQFGYLGVLIIALVSGLNVVVPIPAATFTPVFLAAGLALPLIILTLTLGTLIADFVGYALGSASRELVKTKHPKIFTFFSNLQQNHTKWILPAVFLYAAFVPFPNEAVIIPLALTGIRFWYLLIPLFFGNLIHQILFSYGITSIFSLF